MSNNNKQNFIQRLNQIQLSATDRKRVRAELEAYADANKPTASPWIGVLSPLQKLQKPALVVATLFFIVGGISLAAEEALPGDSLYAVKLNINERVMGLASLNDISDAENESRITSRRIAELEELAARGVLNPDVSKRLTAAISQHTRSAREHIKAASEAGEISSALSLETELVSMLNTHGDILEQLGVKNDGSFATTTMTAATELRQLAQSKAEEDVTTAVTHSRSVQVRTSDDDTISPEQAKKLLARTAGRLTDVKNSFNNNYDSFVNEELRSSLEELLLHSADDIDVAMQSLEKEEYGQVKKALQQALTYAHEVSILIEVHESFDLPQSDKSSQDAEVSTSTQSDTATTTDHGTTSTSNATTSQSDDGKGNDSEIDTSLPDEVSGAVQSTSSSSTAQQETDTSSASSSTATSTATGSTVGLNAKKEWSVDSEAYVRITEVLDRVEVMLSEPKTGPDSGMLPGRTDGNEEN